MANFYRILDCKIKTNSGFENVKSVFNMESDETDVLTNKNLWQLDTTLIAWINLN